MNLRYGINNTGKLRTAIQIQGLQVVSLASTEEWSYSLPASLPYICFMLEQVGKGYWHRGLLGPAYLGLAIEWPAYSHAYYFCSPGEFRSPILGL